MAPRSILPRTPSEPDGGAQALVHERDPRGRDIETRQRDVRAATLLAITSAIADAVTSDEVFAALVDQVADAVGASSAALWLVAGPDAELVRSRGYSEAAQALFARLPL